jgi:hypothetical protein
VRSVRCLGLLSLATTIACGSLSPTATAPAAHDPTPLTKCRVAPSAASPLVTEWPASEKAHLQSLAGHQPVAVAYSGCDLRIVDACKLAGRYTWRRTTLASDTIEITTDDELWAKLPLGAAGLEGELGRSGRLAVRTTVAGQLALEGLDPNAVPTDAACTGVTHIVSGIAVGAFGLTSGGATSARGGASVAGVGAGASTRRDEQVVRQAGDPRACADATDSSPHAQCGAPIQLFLQPLATPAKPAATAAGDDQARARQTGIEVVFPAPRVAGERWTLREAAGTVACELPCTRWVGPGSGYYLERSAAGGFDVAHLEVPVRLTHPAGSRVTADYQAERGSPLLSKLTFWLYGVPTGVLGAGMLVGGAAGAFEREGQSSTRGFFVLSGALFLGVSAAATWWFLWSHPASFETKSPGNAAAIRVGPGFVTGSF